MSVFAAGFCRGCVDSIKTFMGLQLEMRPPLVLAVQFCRACPVVLEDPVIERYRDTQIRKNKADQTVKGINLYFLSPIFRKALPFLIRVLHYAL